MRMILSSTLAVLIGTGAALAFPTEEVPTSEPAYLAKVKTAAPAEIVAKASIVMMQDGKPRSIQIGTNGFTCLISPDGTPFAPTVVSETGHMGSVGPEEPLSFTQSNQREGRDGGDEIISCLDCGTDTRPLRGGSQCQ